MSRWAELIGPYVAAPTENSGFGRLTLYSFSPIVMPGEVRSGAAPFTCIHSDLLVVSPDISLPTLFGIWRSHRPVVAGAGWLVSYSTRGRSTSQGACVACGAHP